MTIAVRTATAADAGGARRCRAARGPARASRHVPSAIRPTGPQTGEADAITFAVCIFLT